MKELPLVLVLLINVRVHVTVLSLLILNEAKEALIDCNFELLMIVGVLYDLVDCVFEAVDICIIITNDVPVARNRLCDQGLSHTEIFNHKAETSVDRVVLFQFLIKGLRH